MKVLKISDNTFLVRLIQGEKLMQSLIDFHVEYAHLNVCLVTGIGAVTDVVLGKSIYDDEGNKVSYDYVQLEQNYEIISLNGNITLKKNLSLPHIHVSLANDNFELIGGHLDEATINLTCELSITVFDKKINRIEDKETKLKVWDI